MELKTLCAVVLASAVGLSSTIGCVRTAQVEVESQIEIIPQIPIVDISAFPTEQEFEIEDIELDGNHVIDAYPLKFNIKSNGVGNNKTLQYLVLNEEEYDMLNMLVFELEQISQGNTTYWDLTKWFQCPNVVKSSDNKYRFSCWPMKPDSSSAREMVRKTANFISKYRRDKKITPDQDYLNGFSALMGYQGPNNSCDEEPDDDLDSNWGKEITIDFYK